MIFTAYFDEADTHGPSPTVIMAAYLGHAYQWQRFEIKLSRLQEAYGFKVFHATEFKNQRGEFTGWSDDKCMRLLNDLIALVSDNLALGLTVALERDRFLNEYRAPPIPNKMHMDSQFGACFRACLASLHDFLTGRQNRDRLNIVFERGHKNVGDCERIFNDLKMRLFRAGSDVFDGFTIESKETCPPLMVADMLAHTHSMIRAQSSAGTLAPGIFKPATVQKGALAFLELAPNALADLKTGFNKMRQLEIDEWRAKRTAKKALELSSGRQSA